MVMSLLSIYKHRGYLPDCRMSYRNDTFLLTTITTIIIIDTMLSISGFTQDGSKADVVIVDAYLKNITTGIDWTLAYEAIVKDAETEPSDWNIEGRGSLASWRNLGYIPLEISTLMALA